MKNDILAWHFVSDTLRNGEPVPADGDLLVHKGPLQMCESGLHASKNPRDALFYAPGSTLCRVRCSGDIETGIDKIVCSKRVILWRIEANKLMPAFSRWCALQCVKNWAPPSEVTRYLMTGDPSLRAAARSAAESAARSAAESAADAAESAADAARSAQIEQLTTMIMAVRNNGASNWMFELKEGDYI